MRSASLTSTGPARGSISDRSGIFAAFQDPRVRIAALVLAALKLWFVSAQPVIARAGTVHDDQLFLQLADSILRGDWLGPYSQFTLMKGCGYPLFIAAAFRLGLPLPLAEHAFYLLACWLLVRALRPLLAHDLWSLALFALLAWQPMSYWLDPMPGGGNILRQNLYTPLTLFMFAGLIALHTRSAAPRFVRLGWGALLGVSFGWFWLTREESIWIAPSIVLLALAAWVPRFARRQFAPALFPAAMALAAALLPILAVCTLNARFYGWFGTVEFRAPEFVSAYAALGRVRPVTDLERVPLPREARLQIYPVSPAFARLRPLLEGNLGANWGGSAHEFNGGRWVWALRDAVSVAIHPRNAREALAFYGQIATEVNAACDAGRLPAAPRRDSFLPRWTPLDTRLLRQDGLSYFLSFVGFDHFNARPHASAGNAAQLRLFRDLTQWHLAPSPQAPELATPRARAARAWRIGALQDIGRTVRWICLAVEALGALAWAAVLVRGFRRRAWPGYLWWTAGAALAGAFAVFVISLLVHVTSWVDWRPLRFSEAYPLVLLFGFTACIEWLLSPRLALAGISDHPPR